MDVGITPRSEDAPRTGERPLPVEGASGRSQTGLDHGRRTKSGSLASNAYSLIVSRVAVAGMGWFGTLLIVRHLSVRDWGRFSFVFALLGMSDVITGMVNPRIVFTGLEEDDGQLAGSFILLRLALGTLTYAVAMSIVVLANYPPSVIQATAIAGLCVIIATSGAGYDVVFQFRMQLSQVALAAALGQAVQLCFIVVLAAMGSSMVVFTIPAVICEVVTIAWKLFRLPSKPQLHYRLIWSHWLDLLKRSVPLAIGGALATLYYSLDNVMLSKLATFKDVGLYAISYKFAGILVIFPQAVGAALFATLVRFWPRRSEEFRSIIRRATRFYLVVGAIVIAEFLVFAEKIITLLYGHTYAASSGAARVVVASECLGFFTSLAVMGFVAMDRNRFYPVAALLGLALNIGLNFWFIPMWSFMGSAWATIITEAAVLTSLWIPLTRLSGSHLAEPDTAAKVLLSAGVAAGTAVGLGVVVPWPIAAVVAALAYVGSLALLRLGGKGGLWSVIKLEAAPCDLANGTAV